VCRISGISFHVKQKEWETLEIRGGNAEMRDRGNAGQTEYYRVFGIVRVQDNT
jgi:hypothetical protein